MFLLAGPPGRVLIEYVSLEESARVLCDEQQVSLPSFRGHWDMPTKLPGPYHTREMSRLVYAMSSPSSGRTRCFQACILHCRLYKISHLSISTYMIQRKPYLAPHHTLPKLLLIGEPAIGNPPSSLINQLNFNGTSDCSKSANPRMQIAGHLSCPTFTCCVCLFIRHDDMVTEGNSNLGRTYVYACKTR